MIGRIDFANGNERLYNVKDHLGSTRLVYGTGGAIREQMNYLPYGEFMTHSATTIGKFKFTGKERDTETNYDYFGARYYNNKLGLWNSVDPLAHKRAGLSPYNYCQNNPINRFDPDGREDWLAAFFAGGRVLAGAAAYTTGKVLMVKGALAAGPTFGASLTMMAGGMGLSSLGAYSFGAGIDDFNIAMMTPDGMTADATKSLLGALSSEFGGGQTLEKAFNLVEGMILGNGKIGKNLVDGKVLNALIETGAVTNDVIELIKTNLDEQSQENNQTEDENDNTDEEKKEEE